MIRMLGMAKAAQQQDSRVYFYGIHMLAPAPQCRGNIVAGSGTHYRDGLSLAVKAIRQLIVIPYCYEAVVVVEA